jgi:hypothetical protein
MEVRTMTYEDLTLFANQVKDLIANEFDIEELNDCAVVVVQKGIFGKIWNKVRGKTDEDSYICLVRSYTK